MRPPPAFTRSICAAALAVLALLLPLRPALASEYTDLWVTAGEDAWGVNFVQWGTTIFATFYIYGPDNKPVWYVAVLNFDGAGKYTGTLYSEQGTYFPLPWKPGDMNEQVAGTASFQPSTTNNYQGSLVYTVNGAGTITKSIQRLTVVAIPLAGNYFGGQAGAYSSCSSSANNGAYSDYYALQLTQSAGNNVSLNFAFTSGLTCTLAGTMSQNGLLYGIASATYQCSDGLNTGVAVSDLKVTAQGIEGQFTAPSVGGNCREDARFSAARN